MTRCATCERNRLAAIAEGKYGYLRCPACVKKPRRTLNRYTRAQLQAIIDALNVYLSEDWKDDQPEYAAARSAMNKTKLRLAREEERVS